MSIFGYVESLDETGQDQEVQHEPAEAQEDRLEV